MLEFRVLGPLEVLADGRALDPPPAKARALLAMLLLRAGEVVSVDALIDGIWGERPPPSAGKLLQGYVSRLRGWLPGSPGQTLVTRPGGYLLRADADQVDLARAEQLVARGRESLDEGRPASAVAAFRSALELWRGDPLADLGDAAFAAAAGAQLEELRLGALEACLDAELQLGRHAQTVGELRELVAAHPYRERFSAQLMVALYRGGRQADALAVYREARERLAGDLGLEPGGELRRLEREILAQELPPKAPAPKPAPAPAPPRAARRRPATVLRIALADPNGVAGGLDPEALHDVLDRFWDRCAAVVERHGGAVHQFGPDALVCMFGLEGVHEDDALRAVRAAVELCDQQTLAVRAGIDSGLVFVGAGARGHRFATGEPIAGAARLEATAAAGEVLIGARTRKLVADAVRTTPAAHAWRVLGEAAREAAEPETAFVGRAGELAALHGAFEEATDSRSCRTVTVLGPPGIGKSRLVREYAASVGEHARVLVGRCIAYGEGVTFTPLAEIVRQLGRHEVSARLDEPARTRVLAAVADAPAAGSLDETFWAFRRLFDALARDRPLVLVVEDVHWAQPALLDLLESVAAFSSGVPILLVCPARPDLLETRPTWAAPQPGRSLLVLDALPAADARALAAELGASTAAGRIAETADGNPLFIEQLVAVQCDDDGATELPPTIQAVLAARIDRLGEGEQTVLERAALEGRIFHRAVLVELLPERDREGLDARLRALVRRQLIHPDRPELAGDDAFRFAHALIRETAYEGVPKQVRGELHERIARRLTGDATVGYHLEQSYRHATAVRAPGPAERDIAVEAAQRLGRAARASLVGGDLAAGCGLLERATALLEPGDAPRAALLPSLGVALFESGRLADAERVLANAAAEAKAAGDGHLAARAAVEQELLRLHCTEGPDTQSARQVAIASTRALRAHRDELGQCRAWRLLAWVEWIESQASRADRAWNRAAEHARLAGDDRELFEILGWQASAAAFGPLHVDEAITRCNTIRKRVAASPPPDRRRQRDPR
jgi:DNA-binding SARP family transcriptional activator